MFHSALPYTLVRDFAYSITHVCHYGPPAETSGLSTPASENPRRLSDPPTITWDGANSQWSAGPWGGDGFFAAQQLPQMAYGDGPPYSEDEDLHSPVVVSSRHKKSKSSFAAISGFQGRGKTRSPANGDEGDSHYSASAGYDGERGRFVGRNGDGKASFPTNDAAEDARGPSKELMTIRAEQGRRSLLAPNTYSSSGQRDSHFATLPNRSYMQEEGSPSDEDASPNLDNGNDSRYSKDYQFTIASSDEEMHGKAVALFDFERENENELPLIEGQVIWVSYRHGQGWLVAEDPKTSESGLVPEEYVRLLRDIEGGWNSLSGDLNNDESTLRSPISAISPGDSAMTPTQHTIETPHDGSNGIPATNSNRSAPNEKENRPPIVSSFSTSSKDLSPYPHHRLLGSQVGQAPPQVVHYGSQNSTPTVLSPPLGVDIRRGGGGVGMRVTPEAEEEKEEGEEHDDDDDDEEGEREKKAETR